jgi:hypothetical protein
MTKEVVWWTSFDKVIDVVVELRTVTPRCVLGRTYIDIVFCLDTISSVERLSFGLTCQLLLHQKMGSKGPKNVESCMSRHV